MVEKEGEKKYDRRTKERNETNRKEKSLHGMFLNQLQTLQLRPRYLNKNTNNYCCSESGTENELDKSN